MSLFGKRQESVERFGPPDSENEDVKLVNLDSGDEDAALIGNLPAGIVDSLHARQIQMFDMFRHQNEVEASRGKERVKLSNFHVSVETEGTVNVADAFEHRCLWLCW